MSCNGYLLLKLVRKYLESFSFSKNTYIKIDDSKEYAIYDEEKVF